MRSNKGFVLVFISVLMCVFALVSVKTSALSQAWYMPGNPPAGYLDQRDQSGNLIHMLNTTDAVVTDIRTNAPGDYCNSYKANSSILFPNGYNQITSTGFNPGDNLNDWQEGDAQSSNICQSRQGTWGFKASGAFNNSCSPGIVCGMHHFARLSNGQSNRPWSDTFGSSPAPALTFSTTVKPQTANGNTVGYICPLLQDVTTGNYVEQCLVEWQKGSGFPSVTEDTNGITCASVDNSWNLDTSWTTIISGRNWITQRAGSNTTFQFGSPTTANFTATITAQNLRNVIAKINYPGPQPNGCGHSYSTDVRNYALIGFEQGVEGGGYSTIGESVTNERFSTTTDALFANDKLFANGAMEDSTGIYKIVMQADGNLVVYRKADNAVIWANNCYSPGAYLIMQADGNLVEYNGSNVVWASNTSGIGGTYATIQADGNFVIYQGAQPLWSLR